MIFAHVCELDSCLARHVFVEFLERVLFYVPDEGLGKQQKLNPSSDATL